LYETKTPKSLCIGFSFEEVAQIRALLDSLGASVVRVVRCTKAMLHLPVRLALRVPEPIWEKPQYYPETIFDYRHTKSPQKRCLLLENMPTEIQQALHGMLEYSGLTVHLVIATSEIDRTMLIGDLINNKLKSDTVFRFDALNRLHMD
jgi:hypothetical protein